MSACEFVFEAIGTRWKISIDQELSPTGRTALLDTILARIERFDRSFSRFRDDSDVTRWSRASGTYPLPEDAAPLFALYRALYDATGGAVTPLIGQTLVDAGYDARYSLKPKERISSPLAWDDAIEVGHESLVVKRPSLLDFGAAG
ncbi:FAD:protein FMN transferase, partial [bacterium]|nr:FAD:protein FMN transferase [bacterium]